MNVENLTILANYLDAHVQPSRFDMWAFAKDEYGEDVPFEAANECGTICCAAGHGPHAGIPIGPSDEYWTDYIERVFGLTADMAEWDWCFGGSWFHVDNTPTGAAQRIRHLITNGLPRLSKEQMYGHAPYIFAEATA